MLIASFVLCLHSHAPHGSDHKLSNGKLYTLPPTLGTTSTTRSQPQNLTRLSYVQILQYFATRPGPLSQEPITYTPECIAQLLERLRPYDLTKAEIIMLFNHRPETIATLNTIVEDLEERFSAEDQEALIGIVIDVLGQSAPVEEEGVEDTAMENGGP